MSKRPSYSIRRVPTIHQSGFYPIGKIGDEPLRNGRYYIVDVPVSGDAPKHFIRVYEYGKVKKAQRRNWIPYIAKIGHKWYPMESITEYMLNRIGMKLGIRMAHSKLTTAKGQIWFLSKYFLNKDERLVHGAQIYAGLLEDEDFVEDIERQGMARDFFTFQFTKEALAHIFPEHIEEILLDFVKMIVFDAVVGNNDRHFYNWGVVVDLKGNKKPEFSPVYDTARGLFWNLSEQKIVEFMAHPKQFDQRLNKYINESRPKIGWDKAENINHFKLIKLLYDADNTYKAVCDEMLTEENLTQTIRLLDSEFERLISPARRLLIKVCLQRRFQVLQSILSTAKTT